MLQQKNEINKKGETLSACWEWEWSN